MTSKRNYSIRIIATSLETAHRQVANSRQSLLERGLYDDYLLLTEFCQVLNAFLIELVRILNSQQQGE